MFFEFAGFFGLQDLLGMFASSLVFRPSNFAEQRYENERENESAAWLLPK